MRALLALAIALSLGACASTGRKPVVAVTTEAPVTGWRATLSPIDETRLTALPATWSFARGVAAKRSRRLLAEHADLLSAEAGLDHPALPPGSYNCRLVSIGQKTTRGAAVRAFAPFFCYVRGEEGNALSFTKQTGTDLPGGWLHPDGDKRYVFLGAQQRIEGDNSLAYGVEPNRDLAGVVERIAPFRWRLVVPWRTGRTGLDVYELTPVPVEQQAAEPEPTPEPDAAEEEVAAADDASPGDGKPQAR